MSPCPHCHLTAEAAENRRVIRLPLSLGRYGPRITDHRALSANPASSAARSGSPPHPRPSPTRAKHYPQLLVCRRGVEFARVWAWNDGQIKNLGRSILGTGV